MTVLIDNIAGICNSSGTGNMTVSTAYDGADPWSLVPDGSEISYRRSYIDPATDGLAFEVGRGTYSGGVITNREALRSTSGSTEHNFGTAQTLVELVADATHLSTRIPSFPLLADSSPIVVFLTGQSNSVGQYAPSVAMVSNPNVVEWQTDNVASPSGYSWVEANPNRSTGYVNNQLITGLRGGGIANTGWAFCDLIQKATGRKVYFISVGMNGQGISQWADGQPLRNEIQARLDEVFANGGELDLLGIDYPHFSIWMQGEQDAVDNTDPKEYSNSWLAFKRWLEGRYGGANEMQWIFAEPGIGLFDNWQGFNYVERYTNDNVMGFRTRDYVPGDAFSHYNGDSQNLIGRKMAAAALQALPPKTTPYTPLDKYDATSAPTVNDDIKYDTTPGDWRRGYVVGSRWFDTTNNKIYYCIDDTEGAAIWIDITDAGGAGSSDASDLTWLAGTQSEVPDGGTAFNLDTDAAYTSGKLLSLKNNGVEKVGIDKDGLPTIAGLGLTYSGATQPNVTTQTEKTVVVTGPDGGVLAPKTYKATASVTTTDATLTVIDGLPMSGAGVAAHGNAQISGIRTDVESQADMYTKTMSFVAEWRGSFIDSQVIEAEQGAAGCDVTILNFLGLIFRVQGVAGQTWDWRIKMEWEYFYD